MQKSSADLSMSSDSLPENDGTTSEADVKETKHITIDYNPVSGRKRLNTYEIVRELGRGEHGRVKLGVEVDSGVQVAIKVINRKEKPRLGRPQGSSKIEKVYREIAILKKCQHPNIVRLLEVLDDEQSRKIYLVLEYCRKGEIQWQLPNGGPALSREQARSVARDVTLGLEYLHMNNIIHRDIKPANLLVDDDNVVKISDFGVSYLVSRSPNTDAGVELAKTVGTPAFFSPELCFPSESLPPSHLRPISLCAKLDTWAFGVTLFCLLYGYLPFDAENEYELFRVIAHSPPAFPSNIDPLDKDLKLVNNLLSMLLTKDPYKRPAMSDIKSHPWLLKNLPEPALADFLHNINDNAIEVTPQEVDDAIKDVSIRSRIKQRLTWFADHMRPGNGRKSRRSSSASRSSGSSTKVTPNSSFLRPRRRSSKSETPQPEPYRPAPNPKQKIRSPSPVSIPNAPSGQRSIDSTTGTSISSLMCPNESQEGEIVSGRAVSFNVPRDSSTSTGSASHTSNDLSELHNRSLKSTSCDDSLLSAHSVSEEGVGQDHSASDRLNLKTHCASEPVFHSPTPVVGHGLHGLGPLGTMGDDDSLCSRTTSRKSPPLPLPTVKHPEIGFPHPQGFSNQNFWDDPDSSSSSEDDGGELTLVVGRNRTRSIERGHPPSGLTTNSSANITNGRSVSLKAP